MKTLPREVPEMKLFDYATLVLIHDMAGTMNKEEILNTFNLKEADLSETEKAYFNEFWAFGKGMAIHTVGRNFIESTKGRAGIPAAMAYLKRFAKEYEGTVEGDSSGSFSFTFGDPNSVVKTIEKAS